ncbi:MAG: Holliday junction resolvase-like protein, partial [Candidatus Thorarchaeota archaeon]
MALEDILLGLAVGLLFAFFVYILMNMRLRHRISKVESEFKKTWVEQESGIRKDAVDRSRYILKGKIAEHMVPLL